MFLILLFKLLTQFPFVSFLSIFILSLLPFSVLSLLPLHHPFFLFWSILCPPKIKTSIYYILFTNGTYFCIPFHTMTSSFFNNAFYKLEKTKFWCLSSNLSNPEDLKKQWLPFSILFLLPSSFPLASPPSLLALLINSLSFHFMFNSVSLLSQVPLACGSRALQRVLLEKCLAIPTSPFFIY